MAKSGIDSGLETLLLLDGEIFLWTTKILRDQANMGSQTPRICNKTI